MEAESDFGEDSIQEDVAVTRQKVASGRCDVQGIQWRDFHPTTREAFRTQRVVHYRNYRNTSVSHSEIFADLHRSYTDASFYSFDYALTRNRHKCSEYHFQLRNLLYSTAKHTVYYSHDDTIRLWNSITKESSKVLQSDSPYFRISTISARKEIVFMGFFTGEFLMRRMRDSDDGEELCRGVITTDPFGITNHVELVDDRHGASIAVVSSNDNKVRQLNLEKLKTVHEFEFPWAVNCSTLSPDKRIICVSGDNPESVIISADSGDEVFKLRGHIDFSFACAWSPDGRYVATGNQDLTTRVYDIRYASKALVVLPSIMGAVRSLRFSDDGAFLAASEPCDFVHIYDFQGSTSRRNMNEKTVPSPLGVTAFQSQVIDFFGEIAGISFTPDGGDMLYIGISDARYGCILEYTRERTGADQFLRDVVL